MPLARQEPQGEPGDCAGAHTPTCREGSGPGPTGTGTRGRAPSRLGAVPVQGPGGRGSEARSGLVSVRAQIPGPGRACSARRVFKVQRLNRVAPKKLQSARPPLPPA